MAKNTIEDICVIICVRPEKVSSGIRTNEIEVRIRERLIAHDEKVHLGPYQNPSLKGRDSSSRGLRAATRPRTQFGSPDTWHRVRPVSVISTVTPLVGLARCHLSRAESLKLSSNSGSPGSVDSSTASARSPSECAVRVIMDLRVETSRVASGSNPLALPATDVQLTGDGACNLELRSSSGLLVLRLLMTARAQSWHADQGVGSASATWLVRQGANILPGPSQLNPPLAPAPIPSAFDPHSVERSWFRASRWSAPLYERP